MPKCGIVVATFNQLAFSQQCLEAIFKYTDKKYPILVIDNNSTDGTQEWLKKLKVEGKIQDLILYTENTYLPIALNDGIKWCLDQGLDYCFVSNDIVVGKNWLEALIEGVYKHEKIGGGSPYIAPEATYDAYCNLEWRNNYKNNFWHKALANPPKEQLDKILDEIHGGDFDNFTEVWAETRKEDPPLSEFFSMARYIKKSTIEKVGLFDEQFVPTHFEDLDYMIRMNNHNLYRVSVTGSYCFHWGMVTHRSGLPGEDEKQKQGRIDNEIRFNKKWRVFLPQDQVRHDVKEYGDKYKPMSRGPRLDEFFEIMDKEDGRYHDRWFLWEPEKYLDIPQEGRWQDQKVD